VRALLAFTLGTFVIAPLYGAHPYLPNGDFDSNIAGWTDPAHPDTSVAWDPFGSPGGALRVSSTFVATSTTDTIRILSDCISHPEGLYSLEGQVYTPSATPQLCQIDFLRWPTTDCTGEPTFPVINGSSVGDVWHNLGDEALIRPPGPGLHSIRMSLTVIRPENNSLGVCYFDNLALVGPTPTLEVPALSSWGLGVLIGLLAIGASRKVARARG
jgi:hypothetical protein